jgi:lauroyl/myristoyl acyltransferase
VSGRSVWRSEGRALSDKGWAPLRYWVTWWTALGVGVVLFYVVLTPLWLGLRAAAWLADLRARLQRGSSR